MLPQIWSIFVHFNLPCFALNLVSGPTAHLHFLWQADRSPRLLLPALPPLHSFLRANLLLLLQIYRADRPTDAETCAVAAAKAAAAPTLNSFHPSAAVRPAGHRVDGRSSGGDEPHLPEAEVVSSSGEGERSLPLERRSGTFPIPPLRTNLSCDAIGRTPRALANGAAGKGGNFSFLEADFRSSFNTSSNAQTI